MRWSAGALNLGAGSEQVGGGEPGACLVQICQEPEALTVRGRWCHRGRGGPPPAPSTRTHTLCDLHEKPRGAGRAATRWRSSQPVPGPPACPSSAAGASLPSPPVSLHSTLRQPQPRRPRRSPPSLQGGAAARAPSRASAPLGAAADRPGSARGLGRGRGGEGRGRARAGGGGGARAAILALVSAASVRLRAAGTGEPRGAQGAGARGPGRRGRGGRERKGVAASRAAAASAPLTAHPSLLRRLGRLPARRGKMPLTQGCEEGAEVAAGAARAAAAAAAVRVL